MIVQNLDKVLDVGEFSRKLVGYLAVLDNACWDSQAEHTAWKSLQHAQKQMSLQMGRISLELDAHEDMSTYQAWLRATCIAEGKAWNHLKAVFAGLDSGAFDQVDEEARQAVLEYVSAWMSLREAASEVRDQLNPFG